MSLTWGSNVARNFLTIAASIFILSNCHDFFCDFEIIWYERGRRNEKYNFFSLRFPTLDSHWKWWVFVQSLKIKQKYRNGHPQTTCTDFRDFWPPSRTLLQDKVYVVKLSFGYLPHSQLSTWFMDAL